MLSLHTHTHTHTHTHPKIPDFNILSYYMNSTYKIIQLINITLIFPDRKLMPYLLVCYVFVIFLIHVIYTTKLSVFL